ncbi:PhzF family phenazine biosynthesis protein [Alkalibacterium pelagium]|uniref:Phenazine biosynthesis protein PhzF family n=1 Tax=Alkalibacterium pelagium TaxID=426702 RepID=A0A1H7PKF9_9LACT|nr:PhzF family phenazine biosynthesis protein [Alkalibacterium pelagium]GEN51658.1 isomerase [Alkalibacterium pelagium]SEL35914.1 phenazine biosynthesis protein PhzF family [Alkalibacterium pelagium]
MTDIQILHYDAFTSSRGKGNPAGIVLNENTLTSEEMQRIAYRVGFNEVAFVMTSEHADFKLRYFSPEKEMPLCGHATVCAVQALYEQNQLPQKPTVSIETNIGVLSVNIGNNANGRLLITMQQASPQFSPFTGSKEALARSIGLTEMDLSPDLPVTYGSTGSWTLIVPITHLAAFKRMSPVNADFPSILTEMPDASVHPLCLETYDPSSDMHGRHFSAAGTGSVEDPVTGTASAVMGAYYLKYIADQTDQAAQLTIEQGQEMGKDGRVYVNIDPSTDPSSVSISGEAVYVADFDLTL